LLDEYDGKGAVVVGVSCDPVETLVHFAEENGLEFPLLSDESRTISLAYGAVKKATQNARRMTVVVNKDGTIRETLAEFDPREGPHQLLSRL